MNRRFTTRWVTLKEAARFIALHHRHHDPAQGGIVALGMFEGVDLVGVGVLGRPVNRDLCGNAGHANCAASQLEARLRRVSQALGFKRMTSYTLAEEKGASWRGAGMQADIELVGGGEWTTQSRVRNPATHPTKRRVRWWAELKQQREIELVTAATFPAVTGETK